MHCAAGDFHPGGERSGLHIAALEGGQQGRVDIEHTAFPGAYEIGGQDAHETGQADQVDGVAGQIFRDCRLEGRAVVEIPVR